MLVHNVSDLTVSEAERSASPTSPRSEGPGQLWPPTPESTHLAHRDPKRDLARASGFAGDVLDASGGTVFNATSWWSEVCLQLLLNWQMPALRTAKVSYQGKVRPSDLDKTEQTAQDSAQDTAQDKAQDSAQDTAQEPQEPQLSKRQRQRLRQRQAREDAKRETTKATRAEEHAVSGANGVTRASRSSGHKAEQRLEALEVDGSRAPERKQRSPPGWGKVRTLLRLDQLNAVHELPRSSSDIAAGRPPRPLGEEAETAKVDDREEYPITPMKGKARQSLPMCPPGSSTILPGKGKGKMELTGEGMKGKGSGLTSLSCLAFLEVAENFPGKGKPAWYGYHPTPMSKGKGKSKALLVEPDSAKGLPAVFHFLR
ncbi:unnamed protein product [Symbiodinium sp. KB8]|nr:unnamed protein product [Symbiodinium sp. KB8]